MKSIIFLDIDGVLVTNRGADYWMKTKGDIFYNNTSLELFCPNAVSNLNKLIRNTGSDIVLISNMRKNMSLKEINDLFKSMGVIGKVIDVTPYSKKELERGEEIKKWFNINGTPETYVIIDDECDVDICDEYFPKERCVQTTSVFGIAGKFSYKRAVNILNKKKQQKAEDVKVQEKEYKSKLF